MEQDPLTYTVIGCAMRVHRRLGAGFQEKIYHKALEIELEKAGISYKSELQQSIFYEGKHIGWRRVDMVVAGCLILELKAIAALKDEDLVQAKNYTVVFNFPKGLLFNFGAASLEYKLVFNPRSSSLAA